MLTISNYHQTGPDLTWPPPNVSRTRVSAGDQGVSTHVTLDTAPAARRTRVHGHGEEAEWRLEAVTGGAATEAVLASSYMFVVRLGNSNQEYQTYLRN